MSALQDDKFSDRLSKQDAARAAMLARFRARPGPDDPAVVERRAAQALEQQARDLEAQARAAEEVARSLALAAERKAARDAKYAARVARRK